jgi:arylsulfatase A-like enzyme
MIKLILFIIYLLLTACTANNKTELQNTKYTKPNILFILADDQRADALGCTGNSYIKTPNIDKIAENGVRFTNCYVMGGHHAAVCAPSRAMLMSGKSLFNVYDKLDGITTMPKYFSENGYTTFGTGKWHNGIKSFESSFQKGDNVFIGGMSDHFQIPCRQLGEDGKLSKPVNKSFSTDLFADAAINFLNNHSKNSNPFFCYVAFTAPHDPRSPHQDYIGMYPDSAMPLPGNFMELHPFEFDDLNIRDETLAPWPRTPEMIRASFADYYALIAHLDDRVGSIIQTLKKLNLYDNTIIVYSADNGLALGSHGLLGKQNLYEHSTKVPLIITGPGIPQKGASDALLYLFDIFPTLTNLCKMPSPDGINGLDFSNIIHGNSKEVRNSLYTTYRNTAKAVRTKEWKLIWYPQRNYLQLFNLFNDPLEINNLAYNKGMRSQLTQMKQLLEDHHSAAMDTSNLYPAKILPLKYDYTKLKQKPDTHQPEYVLKKYFGL